MKCRYNFFEKLIAAVITARTVQRQIIVYNVFCFAIPLLCFALFWGFFGVLLIPMMRFSENQNAICMRPSIETKFVIHREFSLYFYL